MAPNLREVTGVGAGGDGQFLADHPAPHLGAGIARRGRVAHRVEADGAVRADQSLLAQCERERLDGQDVQRGALHVQAVGGYLPGCAVTTGVHRIAPGQAGIGELGEGVVGGQQVRAGGHQVGLRDTDRGLRTALRFGVVGHAADHLAAVVPARGDHLRMPHRDPGDVLDGHRLRIVGQHIRRRPADPPERGVQAGHQRAQRAVPDRDHHPEPRPGQPGAEQPGPTPRDARTLAPVELQRGRRVFLGFNESLQHS